jgi:hypothetical protein
MRDSAGAWGGPPTGTFIVITATAIAAVVQLRPCGRRTSSRVCSLCSLALRIRSPTKGVVPLQHFALVGALCDDLNDAARLIGFVDARFSVLSYEREYTEHWCFEKLMAALRERLTDPEIERLTAEGAPWTEDRAVQNALTV